MFLNLPNNNARDTRNIVQQSCNWLENSILRWKVHFEMSSEQVVATDNQQMIPIFVIRQCRNIEVILSAALTMLYAKFHEKNPPVSEITNYLAMIHAIYKVERCILMHNVALLKFKAGQVDNCNALKTKQMTDAKIAKIDTQITQSLQRDAVLFRKCVDLIIGGNNLHCREIMMYLLKHVSSFVKDQRCEWLYMVTKATSSISRSMFVRFLLNAITARINDLRDFLNEHQSSDITLRMKLVTEVEKF